MRNIENILYAFVHIQGTIWYTSNINYPILSCIVYGFIQYTVYYIKVLTRFLNPIKAPKNVSGTDTKNHNNNNASNVENGIAAELSFAQRTKFIIKNKQNTTLKNK